MTSIPTRLTLVHQVEEILRQEIRTGKWVKILPGEIELCRQLQVSRTTMRAALATLTREKWISSSQGRRREIRLSAKVTKGPGRSGAVMLLAGVPMDALSGNSLFLIDDLREQLAKAGFDLDVHASRTLFAHGPGTALRRLADARRPVGWVLFSATEALQRWFQNEGLPCVLAGSCHAGITLPSVDVDFDSVGQHAARQFVSRGHRKLAVLVPALGMAGEPKTVGAFLAACQTKENIEVRVIEHNGTPAMITRRLEMLLEHWTPTGLFVAGVPYVLTALTTLARLGQRVPEDVSVISRDNESLLAYVVPALTRYSVSPAKLAQKLSRTVVAVAQGGSVPLRNQLLIPEFLAGATFAYVAAQGPSR